MDTDPIVNACSAKKEGGMMWTKTKIFLDFIEKIARFLLPYSLIFFLVNFLVTKDIESGMWAILCAMGMNDGKGKNS